MDTMAPADPYRTLGVKRSATEAELRAAYRRLVQLHHPDHNGGSAESARRFEEVQDAYAEVRRLRKTAGGAGRDAAGGAGRRTAGGAGRGTAPTDPAPGPGDPDLEARLAAMERDLKAARDARDRAAQKVRHAEEEALRDLREMAGRRGTDEELGYYSTDDSLSKIFDDFASEVSDRFTEAKGTPAAHRVADLLDELSEKLRGDPPEDRRRGE
jgi:curved DNA-binding protein CbpA